MSVFTVVPVKSLPESKTRLSIVLDPQERRTFALTMLEDVLRVVKSSSVHQIVVISSDQAVQGPAEDFGAIYLPEMKMGLNQAIKQATEWCIQKDAETVLVLPADIPLITSKGINQIIKLGSKRNSVVVSPSQNGGTNALLRKPPNVIPTRFGPNSFVKHLNEASTKGVLVKIYRSKRVAMDIDSVNDLEKLLKVKGQTASHRFLEQIEANTRLKFGARNHRLVSKISDAL